MIGWDRKKVKTRAINSLTLSVVHVENNYSKRCNIKIVRFVVYTCHLQKK